MSFIKAQKLLIFLMGLLAFNYNMVQAQVQSAVKQTDSAVFTLVSEALEKNPALVEMRKKVIAAKAKIGIVSSWDDPTINLEYEMIHRDKLNPFTSSQDKLYGFSQMFPFPGKLFLKGRMQARQASMMEQELKAMELMIAMKVKEAYYKLFYAYKLVEIHREHEIILKDFSNIAEAKYRVGAVSQADVLKARVEYSKAFNNRVVAVFKIKEVETTLNLLLNRDAAAFIPSPVSGVSTKLPEELAWTFEGLVEVALQHRPEMKASELAVSEKKFALTMAVMEYLPDFEVSARKRITGGQWHMWDAMFGISVPLWFLTKQNNMIQEARAELAAQQAYQNTVKNQILQEVQSALVAIQSSHKLSVLYQKGILLQIEETVKATTASYQTNKVDFLMLLDSERMKLDMYMDYWMAISDFFMKKAELERVVGGELTINN